MTNWQRAWLTSVAFTFVVSKSGCTRPNPEFCMEDMECTNGQVCDQPSNRCVPNVDALVDSSEARDVPHDIGVEETCDPTGTFGAPTLLSHVNSPLGVFSWTMTEDGTTAFVTASNNGSDYLLKVTTRSSFNIDFATPEAGGVLSQIDAVQGFESFPSVRGDGLALYFVRSNPSQFTTGVFVSTRSSSSSVFDSGTPVTVDSVVLTSALHPHLSASAFTLYWVDDIQFRLRSASHAGTAANTFFQTRVESTMSLGSGQFALSSDELTLFYGSSDIYVSTRSTKNEAFAPGSLVSAASSPAADQATFVTPDGCHLFISTQRAMGLGNFNIWESRR